MELNGLANIQMILDGAQYNDGQLTDKNIRDIKDQLEVLNRYMIACGDVLHKNNLKVPFWHEVRDNREQFPTLGEKLKRGNDEPS